MKPRSSFCAGRSFHFSLQSFSCLKVLRQCSLNFALASCILLGLSFYVFTSFGLKGQLFQQLVDLEISLRLRRLQFLGPRLQPCLVGGSALIVRLAFLLCVLKFLSQTRLRLLHLR